ncbi:MAG TPA: ComEC/Rec2 family competence protein, partial [Pyrinomonadaceae bacterium]|nr:ComEC/Rec2 family competence protein [Pyrinomonadaceae bacterium]
MSQRESPTNFARYPLLLLAVCFSVGIGSERFLEIPAFLAAAVLVSAVFATLCIPRMASISLSIAFVALGSICLTLQANDVRPDRLRRLYDDGRIVTGTSVRVEGVVINGPEPTADGVVMGLDASNIEYDELSSSASGTARVYVPANIVGQEPNVEFHGIGYGSRIRIGCSLKREESFQTPGVFSQVAMLDQQGIDAVCTAKDPSTIEIIGQTRLTPLRWIFDARTKLIDGFRRLMDPPTAGVMIASLLGDKYFVDRETADI